MDIAVQRCSDEVKQRHYHFLSGCYPFDEKKAESLRFSVIDGLILRKIRA